MKNINIGIVTFHKAHNYGALLQAYALQSFLKQKYNVFFIDYYNNTVYDNYKPIKPLGRNFIKWPKRIISNIKNYNNNKRKYDIFNIFINKYLNIKEYNNKTIDSCNILITGSDQVWNPDITGGLKNEYTLNIGNKNQRRISYAASCGSKENLTTYKSIFEEKLKIINSISIREESCKELFQELLLDKKIDTVLDPTLLLTQDQWNERIISRKKTIEEKYILAYVVEANNEFIKIVNEISESNGMRVLTFTSKNYFNNQIITNDIYDPFDFVNLIKNAEYIITTSFHATVFSILYNKNFWVVPHKKTGSRVIDLLSKLNISKRAINSLEEFNKIEFEEEIDYKRVNKKLNEERKKSINWLIDAIEK